MRAKSGSGPSCGQPSRSSWGRGEGVPAHADLPALPGGERAGGADRPLQQQAAARPQDEGRRADHRRGHPPGDCRSGRLPTGRGEAGGPAEATGTPVGRHVALRPAGVRALRQADAFRLLFGPLGAGVLLRQLSRRLQGDGEGKPERVQAPAVKPEAIEPLLHGFLSNAQAKLSLLDDAPSPGSAALAGLEEAERETLERMAKFLQAYGDGKEGKPPPWWTCTSSTTSGSVTS